MKILMLGNFSDVSYEGMITILRNLRKHFSKKHTLVINDLSALDKCDVVHIHTSGFYEAMKYRTLEKPKVFSLHSNLVSHSFKLIYDALDYHTKFYAGYYKHISLLKVVCKFLSNCTPLFVKRYFLNKMDFVVLPSKWLKDRLHLKKGIVIHQGIDVEKFKKMRTKKTKKIKVSYFGVCSPAKGFVEAVQGLAHLDNSKFSKELFPTFLTMPRENVVRYVKKHDKAIQVKGYVPHIVEEYNKADIIVLPYRHTAAAIATPLTLVEAMACEKAVITTNLGPIREICGDAVVYVDPYSPEQIRKAVEDLAKHPRKRAMLGKKARARIVKYYNQKKMFKAYDKLYNSISSRLR